MAHDGSQPQSERQVDAREIEQAGAICCRRDKKGRLHILLVGSRRNGRWGVPKGHLDPGEATAAAAAREAFEEAGASGAVDKAVFGSFTYRKEGSSHLYRVSVHLLEVASVANSYPEKSVRKSRWFPAKVAAAESSQPGLRTLLQKLL